MTELKGSKTAKNLMTSFAGESQARMRYTFAASRAKKDGYNAIARVFLETADNERAHAKRMYDFLAEAYEIGDDLGIDASYPIVNFDTEDNLKGAVAGELDEAQSMYPDMADEAEKEGFDDIAHMYREISEVEQKHADRYQKLLDDVESDSVFESDEEIYWKCLNCGYIYYGKKAPKKCPACQHPQAFFEKLNQYQ